MDRSRSKARSGFSIGSSTTQRGAERDSNPHGEQWTWYGRSAASAWPPRSAGATDEPVEKPAFAIAERYRSLLELGDTMDVVPQVEIWGGSKTLGRLAEAAYVAIAADHPKACILADVYHLYRGGSGFGGIKPLPPVARFCVFHFNDYPADPPRRG